MHRQNKQPKAKCTVAIPDELRDFVRYLHRALASRDQSAPIRADDFFQCERAYCGPNEDRSRYDFVYFPEDTLRHQWEVGLNVSDIAQIADGRRPHLTLWACQQPHCRCLFTDPEAACFYCDYVDDDSSCVRPPDQQEDGPPYRHQVQP